MNWLSNSSVVYCCVNNISKKFACFDLDETIICSKSGSKFVRNKDDWKYKYHNVKNKLQKYYSQKYNIVIFTNQAGIKLFGIDNWKYMMDAILYDLQLPISIYCATEYDLYRKPFPTMWTMFIKHRDFDNNSFYCGDACGRRNDFSDSDYKFALNCNLQFFTPDVIFDAQEYIEYPRILYSIDFKKYFSPKEFNITISKNTMYILVGNYASGKTHFANKYLIPYGCVSTSSILNTRKLIDNHQSIVIDNTNLTAKERANYIGIATDNNYTCICINIVCPISLAIHNSRYRHYVSNGTEKIISDDIIAQYRTKFEYPTIDEGFADIVNYNFAIDISVDIVKYLMLLF